MSIQPLNIEALREQWRNAKPFPHIVIEGLLDPEFAREVAASYPTFEEAQKIGTGYYAVNEYKKVQITDVAQFAPPIARLNQLLASPEFTRQIEEISGIRNIHPDPGLVGGGIHMTGPRGRLDVHVDFNFHKELNMHRRMNIILFLNEGWKDEWGAKLELWDKDVKVCHQSITPIFNRCVIFETNEISFHGVTANTCPPNYARRSFAGYYYTKEAPAHFDGTSHTTIFRARPNEVMKGMVFMPASAAKKAVKRQVHNLKQWVKACIGRKDR